MSVQTRNFCEVSTEKVPFHHQTNFYEVLLILNYGKSETNGSSEELKKAIAKLTRIRGEDKRVFLKP